MKKSLPILLAGAALALLAGCASPQPKEVAVKWLTAISEGDLKTADECSTARTHRANEVVISLLRDVDRQRLVEFIGKLESEGVEELKEDTASISVKDSKVPPVELKQIDGEWKVNGRGVHPKLAAVKYLHSLAIGDLKAADEFSTPATHARNAEIVAEKTTAAEKHDAAIRAGFAKVKAGKVAVAGDTATIGEGEAALTLKLIDGEWKVDAPQK